VFSATGDIPVPSGEDLRHTIANPPKNV